MNTWTRSQWGVFIGFLLLFNVLAFGSLLALWSEGTAEPIRRPASMVGEGYSSPTFAPAGKTARPNTPAVAPAVPTPAPTPSPTFIPSPTICIPILAESLRVRYGPGTSYPVQTRVGENTPVAVVGRSEDSQWLEVVLSDKRHGWIAAEYAALPLPAVLLPIATGIIPTSTATPTPTLTHSPTPSPSATFTRTPTPSRTRTSTPTAGKAGPSPTAVRTATPTPTPTSTPTPARPAPALTLPAGQPVVLGVVSTRTGRDEAGAFMVVGEIRNDEAVPVQEPRVEITIYDERSRLVDRVTIAPMVRSLPPGGRSPFALVFPYEGTLGGISVRATGSPAPALDLPALELVHSRGFLDESGGYRVTGNVRNAGRQYLAHVRAIVSLYAQDGGIKDATVCFVRPDTLESGDTGTFDCPFAQRQPAARFAVYLEAEAPQRRSK
ncbi:MAG: FxLYD domain-containing protein [Anaerolineae bacterium]